MNCSMIIKLLNQIAPEYLACEWDNVGLLVGDEKQTVEKILVALEVTDEVINYAISEKADMIVTHHPMLFSPIKRITSDTPNGRRIIKLLQNNICYYAMHTNFDASQKGMANLAAKKLNLTAVEVLDDEVTYQNEFKEECLAGIGRIGELERPMMLEEFCQWTKEVFGNKVLTVYASKEQMKKMIHRVSIVPGSGKDYVVSSIQKGADVLITGDMNHHAGLDAMDMEFAVIDAGHYRTEQIFIPYITEYILNKCECNLEVIAMPVSDPFQIV